MEAMSGRSRRPGGLLLLALAAGLRPAAAKSMFGKRCPSEGSGLKTSHEAGSEVRPTFNSIIDRPFDLFWVDPGGNEQPMGRVETRGRRSMNSFAGHVWRARVDGRLFFEEKLGYRPDPDLWVEECDPPDAEDPEGEDEDAEREAAEESQRWLEAHGGRGGEDLQGCPLAALLSEEPLLGFHVICVVGKKKAERLCIFRDGWEHPACTHSVPLEGRETVRTVATAVAKVLRVRNPRPLAPGPALFTASGRRLPLHLSLADAGVPGYRRALVLVEGGAWHWPPVRVGFVRPLHGFVHSGLGGITLRTLSLRPRILEVKSFIEDSECKRMLEVAGPKVRKSMVSLKDDDHGKNAEDWRTSYNYFLQSEGDEKLEALDERVQNLTRIPIVNSEYTQILRYDYWGRYTAHHDFFDPNHYSRDPGTLQLIGNGAFNRLLTVFMYMSDVEEGGETVFPSYLGRPAPSDFGDCSIGYKVKPERQKVIIFYNMHPNGDLDANSLHGGCRVINGTKWSANFWIWNTARDFKRGKTHYGMSERLGAWDPVSDRREEAVVAELAAGQQAPQSPTDEL